MTVTVLDNELSAIGTLDDLLGNPGTFGCYLGRTHQFLAPISGSRVCTAAGRGYNASCRRHCLQMNGETIALQDNVGATDFVREITDQFKSQDALIMFGSFYCVLHHDLCGCT